MVEFLVLVAVVGAADAFYEFVISPWLRKRPVKGAFVRPR
jgi:hypothetical protein